MSTVYSVAALPVSKNFIIVEQIEIISKNLKCFLFYLREIIAGSKFIYELFTISEDRINWQSLKLTREGASLKES